METILHWLSDHLLTCPVKAVAGIECPGCGFQRAFVAFLGGDFAACWHHYPPMIPFLLTLVVLVVALRSRLRYRMAVLALSVATTCTFIAVNYALKMF